MKNSTQGQQKGWGRRQRRVTKAGGVGRVKQKGEKSEHGKKIDQQGGQVLSHPGERGQDEFLQALLVHHDHVPLPGLTPRRRDGGPLVGRRSRGGGRGRGRGGRRRLMCFSCQPYFLCWYWRQIWFCCLGTCMCAGVVFLRHVAFLSFRPFALRLLSFLDCFLPLFPFDYFA